MEGEVVLPLFAAAPFTVNKATANSVAANGGGQSLPMFVGNKEVDDLMLRRFLRARNLDIEKGSNMFLKYLQWRRSFIPNGSISPSEIPNEIAQNKMFLQGFDKKGRPIGVVFGARHFQNKQNPEEFKRFAVYVLDKLSEKIPAGQEKFVVIADIQGWGYANSDLRAYIGALSILQDYYPERLGKLLILHAPYIFMTTKKNNNLGHIYYSCLNMASEVNMFWMVSCR
ncbi:hypothetical protein Q3G72_017351 [Acer saccharum]|nr:hypothetical protein Q3G72_017351 [Acer saccharum]